MIYSRMCECSGEVGKGSRPEDSFGADRIDD